MPSTSKSQQRLFGMVHAYQKGKLKHAPAKVREIAEHISEGDAKHFAKTRHDGLPERRDHEEEKAAAYRAGFMAKCAEYGVDGLALLKHAQSAGTTQQAQPVQTAQPAGTPQQAQPVQPVQPTAPAPVEGSSVANRNELRRLAQLTPEQRAQRAAMKQRAVRNMEAGRLVDRETAAWRQGQKDEWRDLYGKLRDAGEISWMEELFKSTGTYTLQDLRNRYKDYSDRQAVKAEKARAKDLKAKKWRLREIGVDVSGPTVPEYIDYAWRREFGDKTPSQVGLWSILRHGHEGSWSWE